MPGARSARQASQHQPACTRPAPPRRCPAHRRLNCAALNRVSCSICRWQAGAHGKRVSPAGEGTRVGCCACALRHCSAAPPRRDPTPARTTPAGPAHLHAGVRPDHAPVRRQLLHHVHRRVDRDGKAHAVCKRAGARGEGEAGRRVARRRARPPRQAGLQAARARSSPPAACSLPGGRCAGPRTCRHRLHGGDAHHLAIQVDQRPARVALRGQKRGVSD